MAGAVTDERQEGRLISIDTHFKINRHTGIDHIPTITMHFILCFKQNLVIYIGF